MKIYNLFLRFSLIMACISLFYITACKYPVVEDCDISALFDPIVLADDGTVKFTNVPNIQDATYEWDFGDGTRFSGRSPGDKTYTPKPTAYYIKLRISKGNDCFDEYLDSIFVINTVVAQFIIDDAMVVEDSNMFFVPRSISFTHSSIDADHYTWKFGDGSADVVVTGNINKTVTHLYVKGGQYQVILEAKNSATNVISRDTLEITAKVPFFTGRKFTLGSNPGANPEKLWGIDQNSSGQIYLAVASIQGCYMAKADKEVNILPGSSTLYNLGSSLSPIYINGYKKTTSGYLLLGQAFSLTNNLFVLYALRANSSFDFPKNEFFNDPTTLSSKVGYNATDTNDGNLMLCGASDGPGVNGSMYFTKVSASTLEVSDNPKSLFHPDLGSAARAMVNVSGGYLVAGTKKEGNVLEACFFKTDENLVIAGNTSTWGATTFKITDIVVIDTDKYALVGNDNGTARIRVVNAAGESSWDMSYSGFSLGQAIYTTDNRLIFAGTKNGVTKSAAWVEINVTTGALNSVAHSVAGIPNLEGNCITATYDGGFLIGANGLEGSITQNVVIKTNEKGQTN